MEGTYSIVYKTIDKLVEMHNKDEELVLEVRCPNPRSFQNHLREKLYEAHAEINDAVAIVRMGGGGVMIMPKPVSREKMLERLLEKALPSIENEHLYDEIMEALYGNGQK